MGSLFLQDCVVEGKFSDLVRTLPQYQDRISLIRDSQNNTLVHLSCTNDREEILDHLLKYVIAIQEKSSGCSDTELINWVNEINNDGYTGLHLAVSKGSYVMYI